MPETIKELSVHYDPINESNTFSSGDTVEGRVVLEVTKEIKVNSLFLKITGDAHVHWTETSSDDSSRSYSDHERYFKLKQYFIQDSSKRGQQEKNTILITGETYEDVIAPQYNVVEPPHKLPLKTGENIAETNGQVVKPGRHVFTFRFQLPQINMPPSFKGHHGWIKYTLEVKLDRPWKMACTKSAELTFVPRNDGTNDHLLQPLSGTKDKKMKLFSSGKISMTATTEKTGYTQGETIRVFVDIDNSSSRDVKLKYSLMQCQTFIAGSSTNNGYTNIIKESRDHIPSGEKPKVIIDLKLPLDILVTIENCRIIKVQYKLKIYLDVPFASDPEIRFPVVILPVQQCAPWQGPPGGFQPYPPFQSNTVPYPSLASGVLPSAPATGLYPCLYDPGYKESSQPGVILPAAGLYPNPNAMSSDFPLAPYAQGFDPNQSSQRSPNVPY